MSDKIDLSETNAFLQSIVENVEKLNAQNAIIIKHLESIVCRQGEAKGVSESEVAQTFEVEILSSARVWKKETAGCFYNCCFFVNGKKRFGSLGINGNEYRHFRKGQIVSCEAFLSQEEREGKTYYTLWVSRFEDGIPEAQNDNYEQDSPPQTPKKSDDGFNEDEDIPF